MKREMKKLKETISATIYNNIEQDLDTGNIEVESIDRCADYITEEIKDIAIGFSKYRSKFIWGDDFKVATSNIKTPEDFEMLDSDIFSKFIKDYTRK